VTGTTQLHEEEQMGLDIIGKGRRVAAALSGLCLAAACGGGSGGTGPGGVGGGGGDEEVAGDFMLIGANNQAVPTTVTSNICGPARFTNGSPTLYTNGTFEMGVSYTNDQGAADGFQDHGRYQENGTQFLFSSEAWGDEFQADFNGAVMITHYDFCSDNQGAELELDFAI
jgi:hypothetical protein